jgi:hypothetical protein
MWYNGAKGKIYEKIKLTYGEIVNKQLDDINYFITYLVQIKAFLYDQYDRK